jgi:hypothetical protein
LSPIKADEEVVDFVDHFAMQEWSLNEFFCIILRVLKLLDINRNRVDFRPILLGLGPYIP